MSKEEIIIGNILIAEFMGTVIETESYPAGGHRSVLLKTPNGKFLYGSELKYHSDWSWIMPVYLKAKEEIKSKKIREYIVHIGSFTVKDAGKLILEGNILGVFEKIVEAIEWYNKTKNIK